MKLFAYECPECEVYSSELNGLRVDGLIEVRCPSCRNVETIIPPNKQAST